MKNFETFTVLNMNGRALNINLDGLDHKDSLVSPAEGGNCINWILGHILINRNGINEALGINKILNERLDAHYQRGSDALNPADAIQFEELVKMFNDSQSAIEAKLPDADFTGKEDALKQITFLAFHEAYHVGQTGLLRRIAGKSGAIK